MSRKGRKFRNSAVLDFDKPYIRSPLDLIHQTGLRQRSVSALLVKNRQGVKARYARDVVNKIKGVDTYQQQKF